MDLDVVRGIAILLAMGWHFNNHPVANPIAKVVLWPGHAFGWAGVDLFFVLSGFLVGRLVLSEIRQFGRLDVKSFFVRRIFKLWPTLYFFLAVFLIWEPWRVFFFQTAFHLQNYFRPPVATHLWSLAVEEHFYLVFAFLGPLALSRTRSPSCFAWALTGLMTAILALRCVAFSLGISAGVLQVQTQYRIDALACGVLMATVAVHYPTTFERLLRPKALWVAIALAGCAFLAATPKSSALGCTVGFTIAYLASAACLLATYKSGVELVVPWLCKPIALAGVYSYAIYIWHVPAGKLMDKFILTGRISDPVAIIAIEYASAILAGYLMTRLLERPFLAIREYLFPNLRVRRPASARSAIEEGSETAAP